MLGACVCIHLRLVNQTNLSSVRQYINHTTHSLIFLSSFRLSFLNFSLMFNCSYEPMNNSFCLFPQSPFVPAIKLEAVTWPLNKLLGHMVEQDENYGLRVWRQEYFFWFSNSGLGTSLFAFLSLSTSPERALDDL